ncbi:unnamed protein product [Meganyctiphanes norvegica]|uniref:WAP domain-containing protein n=1 Tax=Meganyctiphanes norvegica TaxID=48144 RepID=A0AAV2PYM6_MEGNR
MKYNNIYESFCVIVALGVVSIVLGDPQTRHRHSSNRRVGPGRSRGRSRGGSGEDTDQKSQAKRLPDLLDMHPIRHHDPEASVGIRVGNPLEAPDCPPPVEPVTPKLCRAPACISHTDCRDMACCYNGCVHTCLKPLQKPAAIDWVEDTGSLRPLQLDEDEVALPQRFPIRFDSADSLMFAEGGGEAIHMPGGCTVSSQKYSELEDFKKTRSNSISGCICRGSEIVCELKPFKFEGS